jgi:hypothetical protein
MNGKRVWLLRLIPNIPFGRWWGAVGVFLMMVGLLALAGAISPVVERGYNWSTALFFCVVIAYVASVFHFITQRTEDALDELSPRLSLTESDIAELRAGISQKSLGWFAMNTGIGAALWLIQSRLMAGSAELMWAQISHSLGYFMVTTIPLLVWLTILCAIGCLVDNARLFRSLSRHMNIDLLDTRTLNPFGRMAVSSTLMVVGIQASLSIMWLDGAADPWTTIPGLVLTTAALVFLFIAPVWPIHKALKAAKLQEVGRLQAQINAQNSQKTDNLAELIPLLSYRREIIATSEWPFDIGIMTRLGLYLVIVPLTWIGAALIENIVDIFVA